MYKLTATNNAFNNIVHITNSGGDDNRCPGIWINPNEKTFHLSYVPYVAGTEKIENGIELNKQAFITIIFDNNRINLYVNGINKFSNNNTPILDKVLPTATMYIGGPYHNIGNGTIEIQEFTLYDGVLTPDQITTIYNESTPAGREKLALDTKNAADAKAAADAKLISEEKAASDIVYLKQVSDSRAAQSLNQLNFASKLAKDELTLYTNNKDAIGIKNAQNVMNQYKNIIDNSFNMVSTGRINPDRANAGTDSGIYSSGSSDLFGTPSPVSSTTSLYPSDVPQVSKKILDSLSTPISKCNGCFSLKLLVSGYTGYIIKIRRADGQTMSFNSSSTGSLTSGISNIATFLSGSIGYVDTWYDQSGKGNHATQTITSSQPIFDITNNCIDFGYSNTSNLFMNIPSGTVPVTLLDASYSFVVKHGYSRNINGGFIGAGTRSPNKSNSFRFNGTIHSYWNYWFSNDFGWDDKNTNVPISSSVTYNGTSKTQKGYISNTLQSTILNRTGQNTDAGIQTIGNSNSVNSDQFLQGQLYSVIIYSAELPQSDITILNEV
jgi:hypothetical protein